MFPPGVADALSMPLFEALLGRRSRRFFRGAEIPAGPLAHRSRHPPLPLTELEQLMLLTATGGNTGWHYAIMHNPRYAPHLANYAGAAGGRVFPSAAGFHTVELFFTDDRGTYLLKNRDAPAALEPNEELGDTERMERLLARHRERIVRLAPRRLELPHEEPHIEGHNLWVANRPGSTLIIPVGDVAQHQLAALCYLLQNGYGIYDDLHRRQIPGLAQFRHLVDSDHLYPLTYLEQLSLTEVTAEISTSCYAGALALQAMGLGGWMFDGMDRHSVLGASGDPSAPGLGFVYQQREDWSVPNPTGLPGHFEGFCPPHYPDMRAATEALSRRKFGVGGPFHPETPGPWKDSPRVRSSAQPHSEEFKDCVALQAQYIYDTFGKFPGTAPSMFCLTYLQAHHLDLEFYDRYFQPGAYLPSHAEHLRSWHGAG